MTTRESIYQRGFKTLQRVEGVRQPSIIDALKDIAPDLATFAVSFVYGEIYERNGLTLQERQLITVAALAAMGNARPQLKFHIAGALHAGCTPVQLVELMIHLVPYAGFPVGLNGTFALKEVLDELEIDFESQELNESASRYEAGWAALNEIDGEAGEAVIRSLRAISPDLGRMIIEFAFGDVYTRTGLSLVHREIVTIAALTALGTATPQLKVHVHGLLNVGGTAEQLTETIIHVAAYAGFPAAINAMLSAKDVLAERRHPRQ